MFFATFQIKLLCYTFDSHVILHASTHVPEHAALSLQTPTLPADTRQRRAQHGCMIAIGSKTVDRRTQVIAAASASHTFVGVKK